MNKTMFGIDCPGCGTQRAVNLLVNLEPVAAFKMFPAIYTTIILFVLLAFHFLDRKRSYQKPLIAIAIVNGVLIVVPYVIKMAALF